MDNKEVRRKILEYLYKRDEESPTDIIQKGDVTSFLQIEEKRIDSGMIYLAEKGYIKLHKALGTLWWAAQINSFGKDLVEDTDQFNIEFPIQIKQTFVSNSQNTIVGDGNTQNISIENSFNSIYDEIKDKNPPEKERIVVAVKSLERELEKETPNKSSIRKSVDILKQNAPWIVPVVIEVIKRAFGG